MHTQKIHPATTVKGHEAWCGVIKSFSTDKYLRFNGIFGFMGFFHEKCTNLGSQI